MSLVLEGLEAGYAGTKVLRGINLVVPPGSVVALLGANGAGKTTLLRAASGLLRPTAGRVLIDDQDVTQCSPNQLVRLGVCHVPEGRGVFPNLTVRENIVLQSHVGQEAKAIDLAVAAFPRLGQRLTQLAGTMSGGEQQMLALARAYVQSPRFVLLDEVSMGLAPKIVDDIFQFLAVLAEGGASLLLVEQYVTRALEIADYVYLLNRGEVAFAGEPSELDGADVFKAYVGASI
jgi:branched-chain amino acid transport system ATP-binding protein